MSERLDHAKSVLAALRAGYSGPPGPMDAISELVLEIVPEVAAGYYQMRKLTEDAADLLEMDRVTIDELIEKLKAARAERDRLRARLVELGHWEPPL